MGFYARRGICVQFMGYLSGVFGERVGRELAGKLSKEEFEALEKYFVRLNLAREIKQEIAERPDSPYISWLLEVNVKVERPDLISAYRKGFMTGWNKIVVSENKDKVVA